MTQRFLGKVALVTGGGSGIGQAVALAFAGEGAAVVVAGRRPESLAETVAMIETRGGRAWAVVADVSRPSGASAMVDAAMDAFGGLDIAFNNAGILGSPGPLADLDEGVWERVLAVNVTGVWLSMKYEIPAMRSRGGGVIINMASSVGAHMTVPGLAAYAASKAAVSTLTRAAAREYMRDGVRINAVSPGPVAAPMSRLPGESDDQRQARLGPQLPAGRLGTLDEVAATVLWLASPEAGFVVGHDLVLDGGASL